MRVRVPIQRSGGGTARSSEEASVMEVERRGCIIQLIKLEQSKERISVRKAKPHSISEAVVWAAYCRVKENKGAAGVDEQSIKDFEEKLEDNLYKIWNRMASGTYFPPPVLRVEIPKEGGKKRSLGIPTVADRIAQMVVKLYLEPNLEMIFHPDSYGYRPGKSAHDALEIVRSRCWKYNWIIDMDIKGFFDNMCHDRVMKALRAHTSEKWILLYSERWLKAPVQLPNGECIPNKIGTPQGGVISPLLANLFLHYALDEWMKRNHPGNPFARYADDIIVHCRTKEEAQHLLEAIKNRVTECGLELHPEKTKIVYCKDQKRRGKHPETTFDFLGYTFRARRAVGRKGVFTGFLPAVSGKAVKKIRETTKGWKLHRLLGGKIEDIAKLINPTIRGWIQYYGKFYKSELLEELKLINRKLVNWVRKKYKKLKHSKVRAIKWVQRASRMASNLFVHWEAGCLDMV